jgi:hypothetical protein
VHQKRTKLVSRTEAATARVGRGSGLIRRAKDAEYRGVITTYKLHDRMLANRSARRRFEQAQQALGETQARVLADLNERDFAVLPLDDLLPGAFEPIAVEGAAFVTQAETAESRDAAKDYLIRRYERGAEVGLDSPWLAACLSDTLVGLANAYLGMWSKLEYVDFWYSVPVPADSDRIMSQRWHRDFDDRHLLKAFLYLVDVDADTGPFEFVAGSARGGKLANFWPWHPLSKTYPSQEEFDRAVPAEDIQTFTAGAGTLVLCNTSGFHRGGFATGKPRVLATATYCSPASLKSLTERNYRLPAATARALSGAQRYAVS